MPRFHVILENRAHRTMRAKRKQQQLGQGRLRLPFVCFLTSFVLVASVFLYSNLVLLDVNPLLLQGSSLRSLTVNETHSSSILSQRDTYSQEDDVMDNDKIHIVFSTGCNAYQDWQSYVVFHQIWKVRQPGHVTRIVSGCANASEERAMESIFNQQIRNGIPTGRNRFHLHITPDYSKIVPNVEYKPLNKPFGVLHWMEQSLKFPSTIPQYANTMFIIIDPDQIIVRPFISHDFTLAFDPSRWHNKDAEVEELRHQAHFLKDGHPIAQLYAMGADFVDPINKDVRRVVDAAWEITKDNPAFTPEMQSSSGLFNWTKVDVWRSYVAGPPYIATALNLYQIAVVWAAIAAPVYELTTDFISEMYAYTAAAAHLGLRHDLSYSFMVSNAGGDWIEAWEDNIDLMPANDICLHTTTDLNDSHNALYRSKLPFVLHYCQQYQHGNYYFTKHIVSNQFLSCDHPLLVDPSDFDSQVRANGLGNEALLVNVKGSVLSENHQRRNVFMLCHVIGRINDAVTHWKQINCAEGTANYNKVYTVK